MTLTEKTTHISEAIADLLEQYKGQPKIEALISSYVQQVQDLETVAFQVLQERLLPDASGVQLDGLGAIVGQDRQGDSDTIYKTWLAAKFLVNACEGTIEEMIAIALALLDIDSITDLELTEYFPAGFVIDVSDPLTYLNPHRFARFMQTARPATVEFAFEYLLSDSSEIFTCSDWDGVGAYSADYDSALGFGDDGDPNTGGKFAGATDGSFLEEPIPNGFFDGGTEALETFEDWA